MVQEVSTESCICCIIIRTWKVCTQYGRFSVIDLECGIHFVVFFCEVVEQEVSINTCMCCVVMRGREVCRQVNGVLLRTQASSES